MSNKLKSLISEDFKMELVKDLGMMKATEKSKRKSRFAMFKCRCGTLFKARVSDAKNFKIVSCGCYGKFNSERAKQAGTKHGHSRERLHIIWVDIIRRCENKNATHFDRYGGRGISICDEWKNEYLAFKEWAIKNGYVDNLTIDRADNDGNYEPSNCRWTSRSVQARNTTRLKRTNKSGYRGVYRNGKKWASKIRVDGKAIFLGSFNKKIDAAKTYDNYVIENNLEHTINKA